MNGEKRRQRLMERVIDAVDRRMRLRLWKDGEANVWLEARIAELESGATTPYTVADELLEAHGHLVKRAER